MRESARRVALLARPGAARERLHSALIQVGAELVLEGDPAQLDPAEIAITRPEVVLVALDPTTEQALDRFETVLEDPAIEVMFEEAEVAAHREGWDAARWIRHLAAKLHRHGDVLPSAGDREAPPALAVPVAAAPAPVATAPAATAAPEPLHFDLPSAVGRQPALPSIDDSEPAITPLAEPVPAHPLSEDFTPGIDVGAFAGFDPVAAEMAEAEETADQVITFDFLLDDSQAADASAGDTVFAATSSHLDLVFESELALPGDVADGMPHPALAADGALQLHGLSLDDARGDRAVLETPLEFALDADFAMPAEVVTPTAQASRPAFELALDAGPSPALHDAAAPGAARRAPDLADIERRIASLELVDDGPAAPAAEPGPQPAGAHGVVLVLAGIGGPDAVRQLLGALPVPFARPVLVQQRLDGGRYDKLVAQLQRATTLPVVLAEAGAPARAGIVHILPAGFGIVAAGGELRFGEHASLFDALPAGDSAILLLSGSDAAQVDAVADAGRQGAFVAGQAEDGCYDPAASNALAARGGATGQPAELARHLADRWGQA